MPTILGSNRRAASVENGQGCPSGSGHRMESAVEFQRIQNGNARAQHLSVFRMQHTTHCQCWPAMQKDDKRRVCSVGYVAGKFRNGCVIVTGSGALFPGTCH